MINYFLNITFIKTVKNQIAQIIAKAHPAYKKGFQKKSIIAIAIGVFLFST